MSIREPGKYKDDRSIHKFSMYKGFTVEIRPRRWKEKIWIGMIETLERAHYVADAVRHYLGTPLLHFDEGVMSLPAITCIGTVSIPVELSTREMCANYVREIAKGEAFKPQRDDFKRKVKNVLNNPDFPFLTTPRTEVVVLDNDDSNWEDELVFDDDPAKELQLSSHSVPMTPMSKPEFSTDIGGISGGSSGITSWRYKGVTHWMNTWVARIRAPKGRKGNMDRLVWLGEYPTPLEAAFAHDVAVMCLYGGESRRLNFHHPRHHPIYEQIPRILPDLSPGVFFSECRKVVREFLKLAKEAGNSVPLTLVDKPKNNTNSGGSSEGLQGTSRECPDLCPECGKTFLASQSILHHLMGHWENQKFSPPPQFSRDSGGDSWSPGMGSRWWSLYKGVRYWQVHDLNVDAPRAVAIHKTDELPPQVDACNAWVVHDLMHDKADKWVAWTWFLHGNEILLGLYSTMLEAAYAYDVTITCLGGKPMLNFHEHPIYELIPRISKDLSPQVVATKLKKVVKEFMKLAMEGGYYGGQKQQMTLGEYIFPNPSTQQAGDLDTFQIHKRPRFSDFSWSNGDFLEDYKVQEPTVEMLEILPEPHSNINAPNDWLSIEHAISMELAITRNEESYQPIFLGRGRSPDVEMLEMLPELHSNINAPNDWLSIGHASTRNEEPYQPISLDHGTLSGSPDGALKFTMDDLNTITRNFSESLLVGQGGFGSVYRGQLHDGTIVAVKQIKKNYKNVLEMEDARAFQIEADILYKEEHVNLVRLLGFLEDENELILVTEYVTNGNLRQHLDGVPYGVILDMSKRCRISLDVIAALRHLYNQTKDDCNIIHRDIKSSNILITDDFCAKVAGFGLSRRSQFGDVGASSSSTQVQGTLGYMELKLSTIHHLKEKNDVYSFGELLVEIFTGKYLVKSSLFSDECYTPRWVLKQCVEGRLVDIIDPKITPTTFNLKFLEQIFKLATSCLVLEKDNCPTVKDVWGDLSFIVGHYFRDLKDESKFEGDEYKVQKEKNWDLQACIEPNIQILCLEESEALEGQEPTQHFDKVDSSNPSFMPNKPHGSLFIEGSKSSKVQTSTQLGIQLDVDSKQATRQASKVLITRQDQTSPLFVDIIPDVFQLKSDETYFEMLQEEIAKLGYISRLLSQDDDFEQKLTNIGKTSFFLYFNEKENVFEFYFKNYQGMAGIVGVGLEHAKVVLEDGWRVTVQEISKPNWDDAWKNLDSSSSTIKVTIPEPLEEGVDNAEDSQASIPRGQCLLMDLVQYFILNKAIASFLPRASMTHANTDSGTSSSSSTQDIARSSSSSDQMPSRFLQAMKNIFSSREASNQLKTENGDGIPMDPPNGNDVKIDTTVHLKLLRGGCLYDGNNLMDGTISTNEELKTLTSQLDNTICLEMMFKFVKEDDRLEIQVIVGPISFDFLEENEVNFEKNGRFGWYHKFLEVSFGPVNASHSDIGPNHKALDIVDWKLIKTIESSDATTRETSKSLNGEVKGSVPHILTLSGGGSFRWLNSKTPSINVGDSFEMPSQMTRGGFRICPKRYQLDSKLKYIYRAPHYEIDIDLQKLADEDYRKLDLNHLSMCIPQDVKFEGTWHPKKLQGNPQALVEYSLIATRMVCMTSKNVSGKGAEKSRAKRSGHSKIQKASNEPLNYTQKYARRIFLNHAMTHLNGEKFKVQEFLSDRSLNHTEFETYLEDLSCYAHKWRANPLVELNSRLDYQP